MNNLSYPVTDEGARIDDQEEMCRMVETYFREVFASTGINEVAAENSEPGIVTIEENLNLVDDITYEEFTTAVKQMHPDKASGPDGLNLTFFQHFWSLLGREVFGCCKDWMDRCSYSTNLNDIMLS